MASTVVFSGVDSTETGFFKNSLDRLRISLENVAENKRVCRCLGIKPIIF